LEYHKPRFIVLENVKNLVSHDNKNTFVIIRNNLERLGYTLVYKVLNTSEITGIPQNRERIYIVGFMDSALAQQFTLDFPIIPKCNISDLLEITVNQKYYYNGTTAIHQMVQSQITKSNTIYQYRRVYVRENMSGECPTLTANMGTGGHNVPLVLDANGPRKLTPRECFNFQGFPKNYNLSGMSDSALYKLVGNAVSVPVVKLIADKLLSICSKLP
jgi:DNA (cytosine-5)-methyltransferase 1